MKRLAFVILAALIMPAAALQAQTDPIILTPGAGIGPIRLGMTPDEARMHLGEFRVQSWRAAMADFKNYNDKLAIDSLSQFIIGFDSCYTVLDENQDKFPVYKLYFTDNKLVFIGVTSYAEAVTVSERVLLLDRVRFYMPRAESEQILGDEYIIMPYQEYENCLYNKLGLEIMYDEGLLRYIGIFKPVSDWKGLINKRAPRLKNEWVELAP